MKRLGLSVLSAIWLLTGTGLAHAEENCNHQWMLITEDGSKPTQDMINQKNEREAACRKRNADAKKEAANARERLQKDFRVDAGNMTDHEAIQRLAEEVDNRRRANEEASARREEAAQAEQANRFGKLMDKQNKMLKGIGVDMGDDDDEEGDSESADGIDPVELQMYQRMVDGGAAPQCKGKKDEALINCVDRVLDEEE